MANKSTAPVFDVLAADYDVKFSDQQTAVWLRSRVRVYLESILKTPSRILEVGCGTGEDATWLASQGHTVMATDASRAMLEESRRKIAAQRLEGNVSFAQFELGGSDSLENIVDQPLDLVFGNFGVLNCVENPGEVLRGLAAFVRPGGYVVFTVMGRFCAWETLYYICRGRFGDAVRRWSGKSHYENAGGKMDVWYHSPKSFESRAAPDYQFHKLSAVGSLVPPSFLFHWQSRLPRTFSALQKGDQYVSQWRITALISDHYLISFVKK